jgi:hypothetical protein
MSHSDEANQTSYISNDVQTLERKTTYAALESEMTQLCEQWQLCHFKLMYMFETWFLGTETVREPNRCW